MENCTTTDIIVLSTMQKSDDDVSKADNTYGLPTSGGIVQSIARVERLFVDLKRTSEPLQNVFSNIADLVHKVKIQRDIFHDSCRLLLVTVGKSSHDADDMIGDPGHPVWEDTIAHRNINNVMARFYHMTFDVLERLQESLQRLKFGLQALRGHEKQDERKLWAWLERSESATFTTTEDFRGFVQNLKIYNDVFLTLICEAVPRRSGRTRDLTFAEEMGYQHTVQAASASLSHLDLDCTQRVLQHLYDTVTDAWTCRDHASHSLSILLSFDHARAGAEVQSNDFRFIIAVTSPSFEVPYLFVVNSPSGGFSSCQTVEEDPSLDKTCLAEKTTGALVQGKASDLSVDQAGDEAGEIVRNQQFMEESKHDLRSVEDLCHCLRSLPATIAAEQETGIYSLRHLESRSGLKFVLSPAFRVEDQRHGSRSLDDILWHASNKGCAISMKDRLRTASSLAAGILHLNTTSWLPQVWSSKDVHYLDEDIDETCALGEPFLQTPLDKTRARRSVVEGTKFTAIRSSLLCLGLVLIELAFSAPWQKLQLQEDLTKTLPIQERYHLDMIRLSKTVSRELGSRYAKVVRTCLALGLEAQRTQDLEKAELDEVVFEEVVKELDRSLSVVTSIPGLYSSPDTRSFANGFISNQSPLRPKLTVRKLRIDPPPQSSYLELIISNFVLTGI